MNCAESRELLPLYREGELSEDQTAMLRDHLATCTECSELAKEYKLAGAFVGRLRSVRPVMPDAAALAGDIGDRIKASATVRRTPPSARFISRLLDVFEVPPVRLASAAFAAVLMIVFSVQCLQLADSVARLEDRYARQGGLLLTPEMGYAIELPGTNDPRLRLLLSLLGITRQEGRGQEVVVSQETVRTIELQLGSSLAGDTQESRLAGLNAKELTELRNWITTHTAMKRILALKGE